MVQQIVRSSDLESQTSLSLSNNLVCICILISADDSQKYIRARAFAVRTHEIWKWMKDPTKIPTSSPYRMIAHARLRMRLRRTRSTMISWHNSFKATTSFSTPPSRYLASASLSIPYSRNESKQAENLRKYHIFLTICSMAIYTNHDNSTAHIWTKRYAMFANSPHFS